MAKIITLENFKDGNTHLEDFIFINADVIQEIIEVYDEKSNNKFLYTSIILVNGKTYKVENKPDDVIELINNPFSTITTMLA